jgi:hypothetical protein
MLSLHFQVSEQKSPMTFHTMVKSKVTLFEPALPGYLLLDVLLIAFGRKTQSTIEKLVQQPQ